jgi:hypothetical protein
MEFPKENIIENTIEEFERKHPFKAFAIRLKVKLKLFYFSYIYWW